MISSENETADYLEMAHVLRTFCVRRDEDMSLLVDGRKLSSSRPIEISRTWRASVM